MKRECAIKEKHIIDAFISGQPIQESIEGSDIWIDTETPNFSSTFVHRLKPIEDRDLGLTLIKSFQSEKYPHKFYEIYCDDQDNLFHPIWNKNIHLDYLLSDFHCLVFPSRKNDSWDLGWKIEKDEYFDVCHWYALITNIGRPIWEHQDLYTEAAEWLSEYPNKKWVKKINCDSDYEFTHTYYLAFDNL